MEKEIRKTGIDFMSTAPWGTHICLFYQTKKDLIDILVPYFKAGLENNEYCMWVTSEPLSAKDAKIALQTATKNLDKYFKKGQIEILDYNDWYTKSGQFEPERVLAGWVEKEKEAINKGFDGIRFSGNSFWLEKKDWRKFVDYEKIVNSLIGKYRMLALCSYSLDKCKSFEIIDVVSNHQFVIIKEGGKWISIESSEHKKIRESLWESNARYSSLAENIDLGVSVVNSDYKIVQVNASIAKWFNSPPNAFVGKECFREYEKRNKTCPHCPGRRAMKTGCNEEAYTEGVREDGSCFYVHIRAVPNFSNNDTIVGFTEIIENITERKEAEQILKESERTLKAKKQELEQKNIALREVIKQIEVEKDIIKNDIINNVNELLIPILNKVKMEGASKKYITLISRYLEKLTSSFSRKLTKESFNLSPKEIEICNMIEGGLISKEISGLLNISYQTVQKHRKNIRKKFKIAKKNVNLTSFLQRIKA